MASNRQLHFALITILALSPMGSELNAQLPNRDAARTGVQQTESVERRAEKAPEVANALGVATADTAPRTIQFNFYDAEWSEVLSWYSNEAGLNLDWKELPDDKLNLVTQRSYQIDEAMGVLNRHLSTRGFTLLRSDDALFLVNLSKSLNPTMLPRVELDELEGRSKYEVVKVTFQLDWLLAETAASEFKAILSPYGQIAPFSATNRIEVTDFVQNLIEIRDILHREESDDSQARLVAEFKLQHARATEVVDQLRQLLGLKTPLPKSAILQMQIRQSQQRSRDRDRDRDDDNNRQIPQDGPADVYLVANERVNCVVANGPPDKIALVRQAIDVLDVRGSRQSMLLSEATTMKVYPLGGADADAVQDIFEELRDIGKLHPDSVFSDDDDRQIIFAHASLKDHLTIQSVMDQLAGSARTFRVVPLQRLNAINVAESIQRLMGADGQTEIAPTDWGDRRDSRDRRRGGDSNEWGNFRVEADPVNKRLLLFATEMELRQVEELLSHIGEESSDGRVRVIDGAPAEDVEKAIHQLRTIWPSIRSNPLEIDLPSARSNESGETESINSQSIRSSPSQFRKDSVEAADQIAPLGRGSQQRPHQSSQATMPDGDESTDSFQYISDSTSRQLNDGTQNLATGIDPSSRMIATSLSDQPSIVIRAGGGGKIVLSSPDSAALDDMERLLNEFLPDQSQYSVIPIRYASPVMIETKLTQAMDAGVVHTTAPLSFISDATTKSVMVVGATDEELRRIKQLIDLFDQPEQPNLSMVRTPQLISLRHAEAQAVAAVLKELYRDLLSPTDITFRQDRESRDRERGSPANTQVASHVSSGTTKATFKGMLSVGVQAESNSIIVSAPTFMMQEIQLTVKELDQPVAGTVIDVVTLNSGTASLVAESLEQLILRRQQSRNSASRTRESVFSNQVRRERGEDSSRR